MPNRLKKCLLLFAGLILLVLIVISLYLEHVASKPLKLREEGQLFVVTKGMTREALGHRMQEEGLLKHSGLLTYYIRFHPELSHIKAGTYLLSGNMNINDFLNLINSGKEAQFVLQFVEGTRAAEWLNKVRTAPLLTREITDTESQAEIAKKIGIDSKNIEGWFYPDTYHYTAYTTDVELLTRAYNRMQEKLMQVWKNRDDNLPYHTPYELLIMASLIEKETGIERERDLVASVFINRLQRQMRLQTDPTVIYGLSKRYTGMIRRSDLQDKNPYNTYIIQGLPPTPIAMPSSASLEAAAHPAKTDYLYFVSNGEKGHQFSSNLADHNRAVQAYLKQRKKNSK